MKYNNFNTAIYCTVQDVENTDWATFSEKFSFIEKWVNVDKVYLESYRAEKFVSEAKMNAARDFFTKKGIKCSGGITLSAKGRTSWDFRSFCYSNQFYVDELVKVIGFTAKLFDETILDDFYFTNCKCDSCIADKGDQSWDEYRTAKLRAMSELMIKHARAVNPKATVIIKYPNWYDDYQYTGYNLRDQRQIHGMIYTGTETRDPALTQQNLPRYLSYFLMRYLENSLPGKNGGGWFDPFDCSYNLNSYLEQAYLTLFSKAREATMFCLGVLIKDFREFVPLAGYAFDRVDAFMGKLGNPTGVACYKPFNSAGENYLLPAFGMLGIPLEPTPFFPADADTVILSESAACDEDIVIRIKEMLKKGKTVVITSGLAHALENKGLRDIIDVEVRGSATVDRVAIDMLMCGYRQYSQLPKEILIPKITLRTNDSWPVVVGQGGDNGYPLLIETNYSEGKLFIITIPEKFSDMYLYPVEALDSIKRRIMPTVPVTLSAPAGVGIFLYDNDTFIVESFITHATPVSVTVKGINCSLENLENGTVLEGITGGVGGSDSTFTFDFPASVFCALRIVKKG